MMGILRTIFLFIIFSAISAAFGYLIGGISWMFFILYLSLVLNISAFMFAPKLVLSLTGSKILDKTAYPEIYTLIKDVCFRISLSIPKVYITPETQANLFVAGHGPGRASIVITRGLINSLSRQEMTAVFSQKLYAIKNFDVLSITVGAAAASSVLFLANLNYYNTDMTEGEILNKGIIGKLISLLIFSAGLMLKITVPESREYWADKKTVKILGSGEFLNAALLKLNDSVANNPIQTNPGLSGLFILDPFGARTNKILKRLSTHPLLEERIKRLEKI